MTKLQRKTLIGVLASNDDRRPNASLGSIFTHLYHHPARDRLAPFHFVITGGTWDRIFQGDDRLDLPPLDPNVAAWLKERATALPSASKGGVILLSYLITQRLCSIVWPFYAANGNHWQRHENLAFLRLCDQWHVKRLMNRGSVLMWLDCEAEADRNRNLQVVPLDLSLERLGNERVPIGLDPRPESPPSKSRALIPSLKPKEKKFREMTIAVIAHDEMKSRMIEFAIDHEAELQKFGTILATGTTGREVAAATSQKIHDQMIRYHSGPKGGDIEIATAILYGLCDVVIFFVDPLRPQPHVEDVRVVFEACMITDHVVMITNEMHAREFMSRIVRDRNQVVLYDEE